MPEANILFRTQLSQRTGAVRKQGVRKITVIGMVLALVGGCCMFRLTDSPIGSLGIACVILMIFSTVAELFNNKAQYFTVILDTNALYEIDEAGAREVLFDLKDIFYFMYHSSKTFMQEDEPYYLLTASYKRETHAVSLSHFPDNKRKELLTALQGIGFSIFLIYEEQELGNPYELKAI